MTDRYPLPLIEVPAGTSLEVREALQHWHQHRPQMYAELYQAGTLLDAAIAACEATAQEECDLDAELMRQGHPSDVALQMAREIVRERYVFLPDEESVPDLMRLENGLYRFESDLPEDFDPASSPP